MNARASAPSDIDLTTMSITFGTKLSVGYFLIDLLVSCDYFHIYAYFFGFIDLIGYHKSFIFLSHVESLVILFGSVLIMSSHSQAVSAVAEQCP